MTPARSSRAAALGVGDRSYIARRKQERDPRSFRILDSHTNAHARRERPGQAVFRRSLLLATTERAAARLERRAPDFAGLLSSNEPSAGCLYLQGTVRCGDLRCGR